MRFTTSARKSNTCSARARLRFMPLWVSVNKGGLFVKCITLLLCFSFYSNAFAQASNTAEIAKLNREYFTSRATNGQVHSKTIQAMKNYLTALVDEGKYNGANRASKDFSKLIVQYNQKVTPAYLDFLVFDRHLLLPEFSKDQKKYNIEREVRTAKELYGAGSLGYAEHIDSILNYALINLDITQYYSFDAEKRIVFLQKAANDIEERIEWDQHYRIITRFARELPVLKTNAGQSNYPVNDQALFYDALVRLKVGPLSLGKEHLKILSKKNQGNSTYSQFSTLLLQQFGTPKADNTELNIIAVKFLKREEKYKDDKIIALKEVAPKWVKYHDSLSFYYLARKTGRNHGTSKKMTVEIDQFRDRISESINKHGRHANEPLQLSVDYLEYLYALRFHKHKLRAAMKQGTLEQKHMVTAIGAIHHVYDLTKELLIAVDNAQRMGLQTEKLDFVYYTKAIHNIHAGNALKAVEYFDKILERAKTGVAETQYAELAISYLIAYADLEGNKASHQRLQTRAEKLKLTVQPVQNPLIVWSKITPIDILNDTNKHITSLEEYYYSNTGIEL